MTYEGDGAEEVDVVSCLPVFEVAILNPCYWAQGSVIDDQSIDSGESLES